VNKIIGHFDELNWYGEVTLDGKVLSPHKSQRFRNHSPDGFAWGFAGSGPAQLALAILLETSPVQMALAYYQRFKSEFLVNLDRANFEIEVDIKTWLRKQVEMDAASLEEMS